MDDKMVSRYKLYSPPKFELRLVCCVQLPPAFSIDGGDMFNFSYFVDLCLFLGYFLCKAA